MGLIRNRTVKRNSYLQGYPFIQKSILCSAEDLEPENLSSLWRKKNEDPAFDSGTTEATLCKMSSHFAAFRKLKCFLDKDIVLCFTDS